VNALRRYLREDDRLDDDDTIVDHLAQAVPLVRLETLTLVRAGELRASDTADGVFVGSTAWLITARQP
jgi:hypothetical protein